MQNVDLSERDRFEEERKNLFDEAPERRRELFEHTTGIINSEVDLQIVISVLNVNFGCVGGWKTPHIESRGGYTAVRVTDKSTGDNNLGVTNNYIKNSNRIREPSGVNRKNRSHINRAYADGYHFDKSARRREEAKAIEVEAYVKEIIEKLEG